MTPDEIQHFLVTYDPTTGRSAVKRFGTDYEAAQRAYSKAEQESDERGDGLDIVLLSADSLATIKQTHSSYFGKSGGRLGEPLPN